MFREFKRIIKPHGVIVIFSQLPFAVDLINACRKLYRYEWIWQKTLPVGFLNANRMPMRAHENILVFYKHLPKYRPIYRGGYKPYKAQNVPKNTKDYGHYQTTISASDGKRFPIDVIKCAKPNSNKHRFHPTEKPVELLEYLIETYTEEGDKILDPFMGSGSTGVACNVLNRRFIGVELSEEYFEVAKMRIITAGTEQSRR